MTDALIRVDPPGGRRRRAPVEVCVGTEFLGTLHRDEEEGEVSYSLMTPILAEDLAGG